jgi:hypothetical protein
MGDCYTPEELQSFVSKDINRIVGEILRANARRMPYVNALKAGKIENGIGANYRAVVQESPVVGSLVKPVAVADASACRTLGGTDKTGTREYTFNMEQIRRRSQEVCMDQAKQAFMQSWTSTADALKKGMMKVINADIRGFLVYASGIKGSVIDGVSVDASINGGVGSIDTDFLPTVPNAFVTFGWLKKLLNIMHDDFMCEPISNEVVARWIGSRESIDRFRNEIGISADMRALVTGKYSLGEETVTGFSWEGPYRGIALGVDPQPLRASADGDPSLPVPGIDGLFFCEPEEETSVTNGVGARVASVWSQASHELGCLVFNNPFKRIVTPSFAGEGLVKFPHQLVPEQLIFKSIEDNDCNWFGDTGRFGYIIRRGYRPEQTHEIAFVLYKRCLDDLGTAPCGSDLLVL